MYKIYINDTPLYLLDQKELVNWRKADDENMVARYPGQPKILLSYVDMLEKSSRFKTVSIYSENYIRLKDDFDNHFTLIEAAGGLVLNEKGQILFIFRRKSWDLPKGKIDPGESIEEAAIREVQEETGIDEVDITDRLPETFHIYREKKKRILKKTYWFVMKTRDEKLKPQSEEDIEQAIWMDLETFRSAPRKIYGNINELLNFWEANNKLKK